MDLVLFFEFLVVAAVVAFAPTLGFARVSVIAVVLVDDVGLDDDDNEGDGDKGDETGVADNVVASDKDLEVLDDADVDDCDGSDGDDDDVDDDDDDDDVIGNIIVIVTFLRSGFFSVISISFITIDLELVIVVDFPIVPFSDEATTALTNVDVIVSK